MTATIWITQEANIWITQEASIWMIESIPRTTRSTSQLLSNAITTFIFRNFLFHWHVRSLYKQRL